MPNTIKYSTGPVTRALRVGNFYLGVGDEGKGPTNETGFWNGFSTGTFSYIIYQNKQDNGPIIYPIQNDTELIERTNYIDSSVVRTTKEECFEYFASQSDKMVVNKDYDTIVTDGLLLNLDAGFLPSYPATGSSWYDLSGSGNNGTLVNGPTFSTDGGGSIVFDGVDDYVNLQNNSTTNITNNFTFTVVFSSNDISRASQTLFSKAESGGYGMEFNTGTIASAIGFLGYIDGSYRTVTDSISNYTSNRVYSLTATYDNAFLRLYRNGVQVNQAAQTGNITTNTQPLCLGINPQASGPYVIPLTGNIYTFQIYNRALSVSEISQNYYKGPIVTNGLVFSFDSSNIVSYPFTGATAYSLTGSNTLTLANGVGFDKKYGGRWTFDGSNDRLDSNFTDIIDSVTIECWYRGTKTTRNHLWNFGVAPTTNFHCNFNDSNIPLWFYWNGNGTPRLWFTQGNFTDGTIKQLVFTHQGSDNQAYLNGQLLTAGRATSGTQTFNNVNSGGTFNLGGSVAFGGDIYQVRIYNRALSASEIFQNFNAHRSRYGI